MRVLFSAVPAVGHILPMLDLAASIQAAGHEVRFATHADHHTVIEEAGLCALAAGVSGPSMVQERLRRWPETSSQPATEWAGRMWTEIMAPTTLRDLRGIIDGWSPHVVVHDEGDFGAPVAAAEAGIPWITHGWGSPPRSMAELIGLEPLVADLWASCGLTPPRFAGLYHHALINPCPPLLQGETPGASVVWPLRPQPLRQQAPSLPADAYIGFGTVPTFADAPVELDAAVRACTEREMQVLVTVPDPELRQQIAAIDEHLVDARAWVSLPAVLPSCKVVMCHGGAGTVLAALTFGVPLVIVPRGTPSQLRMASACQRAGVGRRSEASGLKSALHEVLSDPVAAAATRMASSIASMPPGADLVPRIEALVEDSAQTT